MSDCSFDFESLASTHGLNQEESMQAVSAAEAAESHARARWGAYTGRSFRTGHSDHLRSQVLLYLLYLLYL